MRRDASIESFPRSLRIRMMILAVAVCGLAVPTAASAHDRDTARPGRHDTPSHGHDKPPHGGGPTHTPVRLASGLAGGAGSTIGPGGALYVTEREAGRVSRIDPRTGEVTPFASGLPKMLPQVGVGGAMDVAFIGRTAYVLVTLVEPELGGAEGDISGIYRVDGPNTVTPIADLGRFSLEHPPETPFFIPTGVQYALEPWRNGFLVTDGHHNRVLHVTFEGRVIEVVAFDNIVPTGLTVSGHTVFVAQAGPTPHLPEDGRVVAFEPWARKRPRTVASGARLLVDVESGRGDRLYALSQGTWDGVAEGSPALPNTGALVEVTRDGALRPIVEGLNQPTSLELIGSTAYVVTLGGELWKIDGVSGPWRAPRCEP